MSSGIIIAHSKANIISVKENGSSRDNLSPILEAKGHIINIVLSKIRFIR